MSGTPPGFLAWNSGEAAAVNEFLNSQIGRKWLAILLSRKPQVDLSKGTEVAALTGAFAAGYENFFVEIAGTRTSIDHDNPSAKSIDMTKD
jgi:hypothetical protein